MQKNKFNMLVDSAWGSSGKGAASTRLADIHNIKHLSGSNYPNAGHTVINDGNTFVFKALPSGAALATALGSTRQCSMRLERPTLWLGPNSGFSLKQLIKELAMTGYADALPPPADVKIHDRAMIVTQKHIQDESPTGDQSTLHISSTMSGSGAAIVEKVMRKKDASIARTAGLGIDAATFYKSVWEALETDTFLHEVSQGFALSLNSGTHYPFCTSRDCTPQQACSDFGIAASSVGDIYLNIRSLPIRVGNNFDESGKQVGYSGDGMPDQIELTWEQVAADAEFPTHEAAALAERERTTVTNKIRRVFSPSWELLQFSAKFCGATKLILNFPQYLHWSAHGVRGGRQELLGLHKKVRSYIDKMETVTNLPVVLIGTGADHRDFIYVD